MRYWWLAVVVLGLWGCGGDDPVVVPDYSHGSCPQLVEGKQSFQSGSLTYDVIVRLPEQPVGAPLVFVFHGLGGTAEGIAAGLGVDELVAAGMVAVVPQSASGYYIEWESGIVEDNHDLQMFYDLLGCAQRTLGIDMDRVYATGMSAGGLWTSHLVQYASEWLAAAAPFSGGVIGYPPTTERQIPVMLTWGGPTDKYGGYDFNRGSIDLSFYLNEFGHPVIECVHDLGHMIPAEATQMLLTFFRDQRWGDGDPFAAGLPPELPSWCSQVAP